MPRAGRLRALWALSLSVLGLLLLSSFAAPGAGGRPGSSRDFSMELRPDVETARADAAAPAVPNGSLRLTGIDPESVALAWNQSADPCFADYRIQESNVSEAGPWTTVATYSNATNTSFAGNGFATASTIWFRYIDDAGCLGGSTDSNVVAAQFPSDPTLSYSLPNASTVRLSWANPARYGGGIEFESYQIAESLNGTAFPSVNLTGSSNASVFSVNVGSGLDLGARWAFEVWTTDDCSLCSGENRSVTFGSNELVPLSLGPPTVEPAQVRTGEPTTVSVTTYGGTPPYSFTWEGLPAGCAGGNASTFVCRPARTGPASVFVTVTDAADAQLTSRNTTLAVGSSGGGGSGHGGGGPPSGGPAGGTGGTSGFRFPRLGGLGSVFLLGGMGAIVATVILLIFVSRRYSRTSPREGPIPEEDPDEAMLPSRADDTPTGGERRWL